MGRSEARQQFSRASGGSDLYAVGLRAMALLCYVIDERADFWQSFDDHWHIFNNLIRCKKNSRTLPSHSFSHFQVSLRLNPQLEKFSSLVIQT